MYQSETVKFLWEVRKTEKSPKKAQECGLESARNNIHKIGQVNGARCTSPGTSKIKLQPNRHGVMGPKGGPLCEKILNLTEATNCNPEGDDGSLSCIRPIVKLLTRKINLFDSSSLKFLIEFDER